MKAAENAKTEKEKEQLTQMAQNTAQFNMEIIKTMTEGMLHISRAREEMELIAMRYRLGYDDDDDDDDDQPTRPRRQPNQQRNQNQNQNQLNQQRNQNQRNQQRNRPHQMTLGDFIVPDEK